MTEADLRRLLHLQADLDRGIISVPEVYHEWAPLYDAFLTLMGRRGLHDSHAVRVHVPAEAGPVEYVLFVEGCAIAVRRVVDPDFLTKGA